METKNYVHVISEAIIVGGIATYFYKRCSELESTINDLQSQLSEQNKKIGFLMDISRVNYTQPGTPLKIPQNIQNQVQYQPKNESTSFLSHNEPENCENGVCKLVPKTSRKDAKEDRKVVISKITKQIEFDRENMENDQTFKVNTFTNFSPNPVLNSVTPTTASISIDENDLDKILNEIDDE